MEGQFLEIVRLHPVAHRTHLTCVAQYNETINDLLGKGEFDKKKHEIKPDKSGRTAVTDVNVIALTSPGQVRSLLALAQSRRTVASTDAACSPPITEIRAFGHIQRNRGSYARPHMP